MSPTCSAENFQQDMSLHSREEEEQRGKRRLDLCPGFLSLQECVGSSGEELASAARPAPRLGWVYFTSLDSEAASALTTLFEGEEGLQP